MKGIRTSLVMILEDRLVQCCWLLFNLIKLCYTQIQAHIVALLVNIQQTEEPI